MKSYKDYIKVGLGISDIAEITATGNGKSIGIHFGEDGYYTAYFVNEPAEIGKHYNLVAEFTGGMVVTDDEGYSTAFEADKIRVYRAAQRGCIVQFFNNDGSCGVWNRV